MRSRAFAARRIAGFDRFHLVGHSGGGTASLAFAAAYPDRLTSLALMEPAWAGWQGLTSAALSPAQDEVRRLAVEYVAGFEERVGYTEEPDPKHHTWRPQDLEPTRPATLHFERSLHPAYPESRAFFNDDEKAMCQTLDSFKDGWWMRNRPSAGAGGVLATVLSRGERVQPSSVPGFQRPRGLR